MKWVDKMRQWALPGARAMLPRFAEDDLTTEMTGLVQEAAADEEVA